MKKIFFTLLLSLICSFPSLAFTNNAIPPMTSTAVPMGSTLSGTNFSGHSSYMAFDGFYDLGSYHSWKSASAPSGYVQYRFPSAVVVKQYRIYKSLSGANTVNNGQPMTWLFQGSTDGATFVTLDTVVNDQNVIPVVWNGDSNTSYGYYDYTSWNTSPYLFYRLNCSASVGGVQLSINELQMNIPPVVDMSDTNIKLDSIHSDLVVISNQINISNDRLLNISVNSANSYYSFETYLPKLTLINTALGTVNSNLGTLNTVFGTNNTLTTTSNTKIDSLNTAIGGVNTSIGTTNTLTTTNNSKLDAINTSVGTNNTLTTTSNLKLDALNTSIADISVVPGESSSVDLSPLISQDIESNNYLRFFVYLTIIGIFLFLIRRVVFKWI